MRDPLITGALWFLFGCSFTLLATSFYMEWRERPQRRLDPSYGMSADPVCDHMYCCPSGDVPPCSNGESITVESPGVITLPNGDHISYETVPFGGGK